MFIESKPQYLTKFEIIVEDEESVFSPMVLEAAPALQKLQITCSADGESRRGPSSQALHSITTVLRNGALQHLEQVVFEGLILGDADFQRLVDALEASECAKVMNLLDFGPCELSAVGTHALAERLRRDAFPALRKLSMTWCPITDVGVVALAEASTEATQTSLHYLRLNGVGMGDEGNCRAGFSRGSRPVGGGGDAGYWWQ